ncbi:hypothetical protein N9M50_06705 [Alphaproteobacteria bacterium]|nr:hypothetical protein [Alphaproteobacteria bacterium]
MIKQATSVSDLQEALKFLPTIMGDVEYFVFFGTLLGLTRDGIPIENDDDIDCYVNVSHQSKLIDNLTEHGIEIDQRLPWNRTEHFFQVFLQTDMNKIAVDFYFYDTHIDGDYIWEKWNFHGSPSENRTWMKIPKPFIFPIQHETFENIIVPVPNKKKLTCEWLYGSSWKTPKKKKLEYQINVFSGRPIMFERDIKSAKKEFNFIP